MKNATLGKAIWFFYGFAMTTMFIGSYTDLITPWDTAGNIFAIFGFLASLWGATRLMLSKE